MYKCCSGLCLFVIICDCCGDWYLFMIIMIIFMIIMINNEYFYDYW